MMRRQTLSLVTFWAVGLMALNVFVYSVNDRLLRAEITEYVSNYLRNTLDESLFGDNEGVVNDRSSILEVGARINLAITRIVNDRWHGAFDGCRVALNAIDDVSLRSDAPADRTIVVNLQRNAVDRPVLVNYSCDNAFLPYFVWTALAAALFALLYGILPRPLSSSQRRRLEALIGQGYDADHAAHLAAESSPAYHRLDYRQRAVLARLHDPETHNYEEALRIASLPSIAGLTDEQMSWFVLALSQDDDTTHAQSIALHPDVIEIALVRATLSIHGVVVPLSGTPLFYYAWYALNRRSGHGWITNPRSNRPDTVAGAEIAALMRTYGGHGKAVADLESHGLKARTLDQNRSKIKDAITAAIGPELADKYLFAIRRDSATRRMSYRINVPGERIVVSM